MTDGQYVAVLLETREGHSLHHPLGPYTTLGRSEDNHIRLIDGAVSGHHAVIRRLTSGQYQLEDLETTNGTFVGTAAVKSHTLRDGDMITVGGVNLRFTRRRAESVSDLDGKRKGPSRSLHAVKMTVSEEVAAVSPTWEMPATIDAPLTAPAESGDLQRDYERLHAGYELIHAIMGEDDLEVILSHIVDSVIDLMSADRAAVLIANSEGRLEPRVALQRQESQEEFTVSTSILNYVIEHGSAVVCDDIGMDSRFSGSDSLILQSVRSAMCVPMLHDGELVGVLHLDSNISNTTFKPENLAVVTAVANTAAYAIKTAMLKEQIHNMERQRADAMLAMIAGASHFINNPLAVIRANLCMFEEWSETMVKFHAALQRDPNQLASLHNELGIGYIDQELGPMAAETGTSAARIEEIVRALRMFEHQHDPEAWTTFDIATLLGELISREESNVAPVARVHCQLSSANVRGVRERLQLLLTNLLTNAWQAIEPGAPDKNWVIASSKVLGRRVIVCIEDTGRGVPEGKRHRVFAPFDTDRLDGSLGLGLAVAAEIARQHEASLHLRAREGGGTRLILQLPLAD